MSELREPPRWLDNKSISAEVRRELADYPQIGPSRARRERLFERLEQELGASQPGFAAQGTFTPLKLAALIGAVVVGSLALFVLWPASEPARELRPVASPMVWATPASDTTALPRVRTEPNEAAASDELVIEPAASDELALDDAPRAHESARRSRRERALRRRHARSGEAHAVAAASKTKVKDEPAQADTQVDAMVELTLLARARHALPVRAERALELAEEHARLYPHGTFEEEREVLAIESLLKLDRERAAKERVRAFERRFPNSTHRAHLAQLVADE